MGATPPPKPNILLNFLTQWYYPHTWRELVSPVCAILITNVYHKLFRLNFYPSKTTFLCLRWPAIGAFSRAGQQHVMDGQVKEAVRPLFGRNTLHVRGEEYTQHLTDGSGLGGSYILILYIWKLNFVFVNTSNLEWQQKYFQLTFVDFCNFIACSESAFWTGNKIPNFQ